MLGPLRSSARDWLVRRAAFWHLLVSNIRANERPLPARLAGEEVCGAKKSSFPFGDDPCRQAGEGSLLLDRFLRKYCTLWQDF